MCVFLGILTFFSLRNQQTHCVCVCVCVCVYSQQTWLCMLQWDNPGIFMISALLNFLLHGYNWDQAPWKVISGLTPISQSILAPEVWLLIPDSWDPGTSLQLKSLDRLREPSSLWDKNFQQDILLTEFLSSQESYRS